MKHFLLFLILNFSALAGTNVVQCELDMDDSEVTIDLIISENPALSKVFLTVPEVEEEDEPATTVELPVIGYRKNKDITAISIGFFMGALSFEFENKRFSDYSGDYIKTKITSDMVGTKNTTEEYCLLL